MDKPDKTEEAAEALLEQRLHVISNNPHADRLKSAFPERPVTFSTDFEHIRNNLLAHKRNLESQQRARSARWLRLSMVAATTLLALGFFVWLLPNTNNGNVISIAGIRPGEVREVNISGSLNLKIRGGESLQQWRKAETYALKAESFYAVMRFEPNDSLRHVRFDLPLATFEVVGTTFMLYCSRDSAFLAVSSGAVRVKQGTSETIIKSGEFWSADMKKTNQGSLGKSLELLFRGFEENQDENKRLIQKISSQVGPPSAKQDQERPRITVSLKTGSVLRGVLLSEKDGNIEIQTPATGKQILRFSRDEIAEMHFHLAK